MQSSSMMKRINIIMTQTNEAYHEAALKLGLSDSAMWILYTLSQFGTLSQSEIARMCGISKQTIHSSVAKLIRDGILAPVQTSRNSPLEITKRGSQLIEEKVAKLIRAENAVLDSWSQDDQAEFVRLNKRYLEQIKREIADF